MTLRILILGAGKTGTSALFYCIAASADTQFRSPGARFFELQSEEAALAVDAPLAVAKMLLERFRKARHPQALLDHFDRTVLIIRDPRDAIVSRLMWLVATRLWQAPPELAERIIEAFKAKERDPSSIGVLALYRIAEPLIGSPAGARRAAFFATDFLATHPIHTVRYEEFIAGRLDGLSGYLGFPLLRTFDMPPRGHRVRRAGRAGDWKNWFLLEDHEFFIEPERAAMAVLGYADDRTLAARSISPDDVTRYLVRIAETQLPSRRKLALARVAPLRR